MNITSTTGIQFSSGMPKVMGAGRDQSLGMITGNERHMMPSVPEKSIENPAGSFADALNHALGSVEQLDVKSNQLINQAIYAPDSVEAHTVVLAAEKAKFALNLTKNITDGVVRAFQQVTNPR